jgi:hypothetical protein
MGSAFQSHTFEREKVEGYGRSKGRVRWGRRKREFGNGGRGGDLRVICVQTCESEGPLRQCEFPRLGQGP